MQMDNTLYLLVGKSASGKTTIANILEKKCGDRQVQSYTTRPPRYDGEIGHIFVNDTEFDHLGEMVAYTEYNGFRYGTTSEQLDQCNIYVVDVPGVETLLERYRAERPIVVMYFNANVRTRIDRMIDRSDSDATIVSRIYNDEETDWADELSKLIWHHKNNMDKNVEMYTIDANKSIECVLAQVLCHTMKDEV